MYKPLEEKSDQKEKEIDKKDWKEARVQEQKAKEKYDPRTHGFTHAIDKYFKDEKINKIICDTRTEQDRYRTIQKVQVDEKTQSFEEFYKKLKADKIKPIIEKEKRLFETRA